MTDRPCPVSEHSEDLVDHAVADWTRTVTTEDGEGAGEAPGMLGSSPRRIPLPTSPH